MDNSLELICFEVEPGRVMLRPAGTSRQWMDETPGRFAYRCLPLTSANSHGWEMLCPLDFAVTWSGGDGLDALTIESEQSAAEAASESYLSFLLGIKAVGDSDKAARTPANFIQSHFGSGILTFNPMVILRTAPGFNLWVTGPVNHIKDAIQPMSALVESDWMPFTFSVNWKMTRPGATVSFQKGEPFCAFFPVPRGVIDRTEPRLRSLSDDPELAKTYWSARLERNLASAQDADDKSRFQNWYARGLIPGKGDKDRNTAQGMNRGAGRSERADSPGGETRRSPPRPGAPKEFT